MGLTRLTDDQVRAAKAVALQAFKSLDERYYTTEALERQILDDARCIVYLADECLARGGDIATLGGTVRRYQDGWARSGSEHPADWVRRVGSKRPTEWESEPMTPAEQAVLDRLKEPAS